MARPNHSASFTNSQGKTVVITPRDMGAGDKSEAEQIAARDAFKADLQASRNGDGKATERIATIIDSAKARTSGAPSKTVPAKSSPKTSAKQKGTSSTVRKNAEARLNRSKFAKQYNAKERAQVLKLQQEKEQIKENIRQGNIDRLVKAGVSPSKAATEANRIVTSMERKGTFSREFAPIDKQINKINRETSARLQQEELAQLAED